ncbi:MAG: 4Fe-4S binding protein [Rhodospirillaceae bacterium]|nr:4Fe-4S binding protein [Rhodospirillaceae bacterium]
MTVVQLVRTAALALAIMTGTGAAASAQDAPVSTDELRAAYPAAERFEPLAGLPGAWRASIDSAARGYVASTRQTINSVGFAGHPIDILIGVDTAGKVVGARLRSHAEPIMVIGLSSADLERYVASFVGLEVNAPPRAEPRAERPGPDAIAGATVSSAVIHDSIVRAARAVLAHAQATGAGGMARGGIDRAGFAPAAWAELVADGSVACRDVREKDDDEPDGELFIRLCIALATPPRIGQNLLGQIPFTRLMAGLGVDDHAIVVMAEGGYSFKGTRFVRSGRFDRLQVVQDANVIGLTTAGYTNVEALKATGAPSFREVGVFTLNAGTGFDPARPWRLELTVEGDEADEVGGSPLTFDYTVPAKYVLAAAAAIPAASAPSGGAVSSSPRTQAAALWGGDSLWTDQWRRHWGRIAVLCVALLALSAILIFQDQLFGNFNRYRGVRLGFLAFTMLWLGWYAGAQLSVVHVLTFIQALRADFRWEFFLIDPMSFLLWGFVAVAMLFWGRGVFCGWLCPFGALQELLNEAARVCRIPQIQVPFAVHERLWPIKYILFLGLFAVSLNSMALAIYGAEIEPFKTAISLGFVREWPFVTYAVALLAAGLFIERFFCRYLCPLGAALAIPARLRMFDWLKRRFQCGRSCHNCAERCTVQAIHPNGAINPNECIHCLNCQAMYFDPAICPTLAQELKKIAVPAARGAHPAEEASHDDRHSTRT